MPQQHLVSCCASHLRKLVAASCQTNPNESRKHYSTEMLENEELRCLRRWLRVCPSGQEEPSSPNKKSRTASQPDQIIEKVDHDLEKFENGKMKNVFFSRRCFEEVGKREKLGKFEN